MLPTSAAPAGRRTQAGHGKHRYSLLWLYFRRLVKPTQMDFQYTFWTMVQLCLSPKTAYRHTSYHKQTKNQWARDDPAFVVLECALVAVAALVYSLVFGSGPGRAVWAVLSAVLVWFLGVGCAVATAGWALSNRLLRKRSLHSHAVEQSTEWMYAFDIHCNSYLPPILLLYVLQLVLCPVLLLRSWLAGLLSCALYALAAGYYCYLTFLGYSALPFLERTEVFLYPIGGVLVALPIAVLLGLNPTKLVLSLIYGYRGA